MRAQSHSLHRMKLAEEVGKMVRPSHAGGKIGMG
jgi:hypothetical protein